MSDRLSWLVDPTLYTIVQDVYHMPDRVPNQDYSQRTRPVRIFSAIYRFRYPSSTDSTPFHGQPPVGMSNSGSSMTSAYGDQTLHSPMAVDLSRATSFSTSPMYTVPTPEGARTPTGVDQNLFDEPFMLDVNFDQVAFDDIFINMDSTSESAFSSHLYSNNPSGVRFRFRFVTNVRDADGVLPPVYVKFNACGRYPP